MKKKKTARRLASLVAALIGAVLIPNANAYEIFGFTKKNSAKNKAAMTAKYDTERLMDIAHINAVVAHERALYVHARGGRQAKWESFSFCVPLPESSDIQEITSAEFDHELKKCSFESFQKKFGDDMIIPIKAGSDNPDAAQKPDTTNPAVIVAHYVDGPGASVAYYDELTDTTIVVDSAGMVWKKKGRIAEATLRGLGTGVIALAETVGLVATFGAAVAGTGVLIIICALCPPLMFAM